MKKETAINFMLYSLMEVTLNDVDTNGNPVEAKDYIEKAVRRAYRDASSHVLSIEEGKEENQNPKIKENATKFIVDQLAEIKGNEIIKENGYKEWHQNICKKLVEMYAEVAYKGDNRRFSYGIAQKWVNMSVKYLAVLYTAMNAFNDEDINKKNNFFKFYEDNLKNCEEYFHIPVDGYILEGVWGSEDTENTVTNLNYEDRKAILSPVMSDEKKKIFGKYNSTKVIAWSNWSEYEDQYMKFQNKLKTAINPNLQEEETPLDWENRTWIEVAKTRKKK